MYAVRCRTRRAKTLKPKKIGRKPAVLVEAGFMAILKVFFQDVRRFGL